MVSRRSNARDACVTISESLIRGSWRKSPLSLYNLEEFVALLFQLHQFLLQQSTNAHFDTNFLADNVTRGEQTATAMENRLAQIESQIEELLAHVDDNTRASVADTTPGEPNGSNTTSRT